MTIEARAAFTAAPVVPFPIPGPTLLPQVATLGGIGDSSLTSTATVAMRTSAS